MAYLSILRQPHIVTSRRTFQKRVDREIIPILAELFWCLIYHSLSISIYICIDPEYIHSIYIYTQCIYIYTQYIYIYTQFVDMCLYSYIYIYTYVFHLYTYMYILYICIYIYNMYIIYLHTYVLSILHACIRRKRIVSFFRPEGWWECFPP